MDESFRCGAGEYFPEGDQGRIIAFDHYTPLTANRLLAFLDKYCLEHQDLDIHFASFRHGEILHHGYGGIRHFAPKGRVMIVVDARKPLPLDFWPKYSRVANLQFTQTSF